MNRPSDETVSPADRIADLLVAFKLPTVAAELAPRLTQAGLDAALVVVCEVLEMERGVWRKPSYSASTRVTSLHRARAIF